MQDDNNVVDPTTPVTPEMEVEMDMPETDAPAVEAEAVAGEMAAEGVAIESTEQA